MAIARHGPAPRRERVGQWPGVLRSRNLGPVAAAVVAPTIEEPERSVAQLLQDVKPAGVGERAAHRAEILEALWVVRPGGAFDADAAERSFEDVGPLAVRAEWSHVACSSTYCNACRPR